MAAVNSSEAGESRPSESRRDSSTRNLRFDVSLSRTAIGTRRVSEGARVSTMLKGPPMQSARAERANRSGERPAAERPEQRPKRRLDVRALARAAALPTLSGVLYFFSWIGFGIWPLAFVCLVPLVLSLRDTTFKGALVRGWWMGFVTHLCGYTWI